MSLNINILKKKFGKNLIVEENLSKYINDDSLKILQELIDQEPKRVDGSIITALSICKNQEINSLKEITNKKFLSIKLSLENYLSKNIFRKINNK